MKLKCSKKFPKVEITEIETPNKKYKLVKDYDVTKLFYKELKQKEKGK